MLLERRFNDLIQFRHGIIHRFELDSELSREEALSILDSVRVIIDVFVNYLEEERGIKIRDTVSKRRLASIKNLGAAKRSGDVVDPPTVTEGNGNK